MSLWILLLASVLSVAETVRKLPNALEPDDSLFCPIQHKLTATEVECRNGECRFPGGGRILRRIGIRVKAKTTTHQVSFRWHPTDPSWGVYEGSLRLRPDNELHCYSLEDSGVPMNVPAQSFHVPSGGDVEILFSEQPSEAPMRTCPIPGLGKKLQEAFAKAKSAPKNEKAADELAHLLKQAFPKYDCRRAFDGRPVPAWYLCGHSVANQPVDCGSEDPGKWFQWLAQSPFKEARRVFASPLFRNTLDGELAETYLRASENLEKRMGSRE